MSYNTVTLTGLQDIQRKMRGLSKAMQNAIAHGALLDAAKVLKKEVIARAPVGRPPDPHIGALRDNVIIKRDKEKGGQAAYGVLVRKRKYSKKARKNINALRNSGYRVTFSDDAFYWRFVEFGHRMVVRGEAYMKKGKTRYRKIDKGVIPAQPFFRPAIDATKGQLIALVGDGIRKRVDSVIAE